MMRVKIEMMTQETMYLRQALAGGPFRGQRPAVTEMEEV